MGRWLLVTLMAWTASTAGFASASHYYNSDTEREFTQGSERDEALMRTIKSASGRNFRGLGYKKNAKKELFGNLHLERDGESYFVRDLYCGFIVRTNVGPGRLPKNNEMNTEHTWPQSKGARREPARGDLHHLYPTNNPANSARSNHPFGEVDGEDATRNCPLSQKGSIINPKTGKKSNTYGFQPPKEHRGNVARAMFYVCARYGYKLDSLEEYYLRKWHKEDPVDRNEMERNEGIEEVQGNRNPFIDFPELVSRIRDF